MQISWEWTHTAYTNVHIKVISADQLKFGSFEDLRIHF